MGQWLTEFFLKGLLVTDNLDMPVTFYYDKKQGHHAILPVIHVVFDFLDPNTVIFHLF